MSKELYMDAHEELITEYLEAHPDATEAEAEAATAYRAYDRMVDRLADMADYARMRAREG